MFAKIMLAGAVLGVSACAGIAPKDLDADAAKLADLTPAQHETLAADAARRAGEARAQAVRHAAWADGERRSLALVNQGRTYKGAFSLMGSHCELLSMGAAREAEEWDAKATAHTAMARAAAPATR